MDVFQRLILGLTCAAATSFIPLLAAPPDFAKEPCPDLYFGDPSPGQPDFARALKCYEEKEDWPPLIIMYLNGDGVSADLRKAEKLLNQWSEDHRRWDLPFVERKLYSTIEERKRHPGESYERIRSCIDLIENERDLASCDEMRDQIATGLAEAGMAAAKAKLSKDERASFEKLVAQFDAFAAAEGGRAIVAEEVYLGGSTRSEVGTMGLYGINSAEQNRNALVRKSFVRLVQEVVAQHALSPSTEKDFQAADEKLNEVYRKDLPKEGAFAADYKKSAKEAQLGLVHRFGHQAVGAGPRATAVNFRGEWTLGVLSKEGDTT